MTCRACNAPAAGKFCSNCGAPLAGATCSACSAPLTPGAKFCHRCGTAARADARATEPRSVSASLPWTIAAIAIVSLIALVAGQRFARPRVSDASNSALAASTDTGAGDRPGVRGAGPRAPDISSLTPVERAARLYDRVMRAHERGQADTVSVFAPMAIAAYRMLGPLDLDQRYDLGRIAAVSGDETLARAQADSILAQNPSHLLGLILAANAAHIRRDAAAERAFHRRLVAVAPTERVKPLPEYSAHENDITIALSQASRP
jgi:hypothetical protein